MVAEVVLSVMGNRSDRRFPNLSCAWALEAAEVTRRKRADFHQGQERTMKLLKQAEYMAATGFTIHPTIGFRSGLGPYCSPSAQVGQFAAIEEERVFGSS
jgi:hypothetical protein